MIEQVPSLHPCAKSGCRRWSHFRFCPDHADDDQRQLEIDRRRALIQLDLWRDRVADIDERLGIGRPRAS
jgi:hypothetical protein